MIIFRPHRGTLEDAMAEAREFDDELEMRKDIVKSWSNLFTGDYVNLFDIDDIVIDEREINDERNGWEDTRYVCIKRLGGDDYIKMYGTPQCIGMCATKFRKRGH